MVKRIVILLLFSAPLFCQSPIEFWWSKNPSISDSPPVDTSTPQYRNNLSINLWADSNIYSHTGILDSVKNTLDTLMFRSSGNPTVSTFINFTNASSQYLKFTRKSYSNWTVFFIVKNHAPIDDIANMVIGGNECYVNTFFKFNNNGYGAYDISGSRLSTAISYADTAVWQIVCVTKTAVWVNGTKRVVTGSVGAVDFDYIGTRDGLSYYLNSELIYIGVYGEDMTDGNITNNFIYLNKHCSIY